MNIVKRLVAALILLAVIAGGLWYFLRRTPGQELHGLRNKIDKLIQSSSKEDWMAVTTEVERAGRSLDEIEVRAALARAASDEILAMYPSSKHDLEVRGMIEELAGNVVEALEWYDRVLALKRPSGRIYLRKMRLYRQLGMLNAAKGAVASVIDEFPYDANHELGQLYLDSLQPAEAYQAFQRSVVFADSSLKQRQTREGMARALDLLIDVAKDRKRRLSGAAGEAGSAAPAAAGYFEAIDRWQKERETALNKAVASLRLDSPRTQAEHFATRVKLLELLARKSDSSELEAYVGELRKTLAESETGRLDALRLHLGEASLSLAYDARKSAVRSPEQLAAALADLAMIIEPTRAGGPSGATGSEIAAIAVARVLSPYPERWRILRGEHEGVRDALRLAERLDAASASTGLPAMLRFELDALRAAAAVRGGDAAALDRLLASTSGAELEFPARIDQALRLGGFFAQSPPVPVEALFRVIDRGIIAAVREGPHGEGPRWLALTRAAELLERARRTIAGGEASSEAPASAEEGAVTRKLGEVVALIPEAGSDANAYIYASKLMAAFVGPEQAVALLERGSSELGAEAGDALRLALGAASLDAARQSSAAAAVGHLRRALDQYLVVFVRSPQHRGAVGGLILSVTRLAAADGLAALEARMSEGIRAGLSCAPETAALLARLLSRFFSQDHEAVLAILDSLPERTRPQDGRPLLDLIAGVSCLEGAQRALAIAQRRALDLDFDGLDGLSRQAAALRERARREFQSGLEKDAACFPIQLELCRLDIDAVEAGGDVPEELQARVKDLAARHPESPQAPFLHGQAFGKRRYHFLVRKDNPKAIPGLISEERSAYRKSIQADAGFVEAYLSLAETYAVKWILRQTETGVRFGSAFRSLDDPDFETAINILKGAPPGAQVYRTIALYYHAHEKGREALDYSRDAFASEPGAETATAVINAFLALKQYQEARDWLRQVEPLSARIPDLGPRLAPLAAEVTEAEARGASSESRRRSLREREIQEYRQVLAQYQGQGTKAPAWLLNNLAYLLAEYGDAAEALALIEADARALEAQSSAPPELRRAILDTYAWCLFKAGKVEEAEGIYRHIAELRLEAVNPISLHFAHVLAAGRKWDEALAQVELVLAQSGGLDSEKLDEARRLKGEINLRRQKRFEEEIQFNR